LPKSVIHLLHFEQSLIAVFLHYVVYFETLTTFNVTRVKLHILYLYYNGRTDISIMYNV